MSRTFRDAAASYQPSHEEVAAKLQSWLWHAAASGFVPLGGTDDSRWSHDDNLNSSKFGWMIVEAPGTGLLDLYSLRPGIRSYEVMKQIAALATLDPLAAKAVGTLTKLRLENPNVRFAFMEPNL
jgi:hypothetical protein